MSDLPKLSNMAVNLNAKTLGTKFIARKIWIREAWCIPKGQLACRNLPHGLLSRSLKGATFQSFRRLGERRGKC